MRSATLEPAPSGQRTKKLQDVQLPRDPLGLRPEAADYPAGRAKSRRRALAVAGGDRRGWVLRRLFALSDTVGLLIAGGIAAGVDSLLSRPAFGEGELILFLCVVPAWLLIANLLGLYHLTDRRFDNSVAEEVAPIALAVTAWSWLLLLVRATFESDAVQVLPSLVIWAAAIATMLVGRSLVRLIATNRRWFRQEVTVIGTSPDVAKVVSRINRHPEYGLDVVRTFHMQGRRLVRMGSERLRTAGENHPSPNGDRAAKNLRHTHCDYLLGPLELSELATCRSINRVIIVSNTGDIDERTQLIRALIKMHVHVDVVPGDPDAFSPKSALHYVEGLPVLTTPAVSPDQTKAWILLKRAFDICVSAGGLVLLSPLLAYCALRIKLGSKGPLIFRQRRIGREGASFELCKFRTMVADADSRKHEVAALNLHQPSTDGAMFKIAADPRITKAGALLRRWSLDELPQLWNVLKGDMSLVGPRPLIPEEAELVKDHYTDRLHLRPGITGPWQSMGRSDIGFAEMVKLDYTYVTYWSFAEDLRLLLRTIGTVTRGRGAY